MKLMARAHDIQKLIECCVGDDTMMTILPFLFAQLELCQKGLTGYLGKFNFGKIGIVKIMNLFGQGFSVFRHFIF